MNDVSIEISNDFRNVISTIKVIKRNGTTELFNLEKVFASISRACKNLCSKNEILSIIEILINEIKERNEISTLEISDRIERIMISKAISDPKWFEAAKRYELGKIYKDVYGKNIDIEFDSKDLKLTFSAIKVLENRYLLKDPKTGRFMETPQMLFRRVSRAVASQEYKYCIQQGNSEDLCKDRVKYWEEVFYELLSNQKFLPNSPTLMNAGTKLGILSACFVVPVRDSIVTPNGEGIYDAVRAQAIIFQQGGGTGFDFSELRPEGDVVSTTGGVASGPLSFMKMFDVNTEVIKQGGRRRGANMGVLHVWHADIEKFIDAKSGQLKDVNLQNFNISVGAYDYFIEAVINGGSVPLINPRKTNLRHDLGNDSRFYSIVRARHYLHEDWVQKVIIDELESKGGSVWLDETLLLTIDEAMVIAQEENAVVGYINAKKLFEKIVKNAWDSGDPGLLFIDTINRRHPIWYLGKINATNPCVSGDSRILTPGGWRTAREIYEEAVKQNANVVAIAVDGGVLGEGGKPIAYEVQLIVPVGKAPIYTSVHGKELHLFIAKVAKAWIWYVGKKPGLRIITREGYEVIVTPEHKFLTARGWKQAKYLEPGDRIAVARLHPEFIEKVLVGSIKIDEDVAFAFGWLVGNGTINEYYVAWHFSPQDAEALEQIKRAIIKLGANPDAHIYLNGNELILQFSKDTMVYKKMFALAGNLIMGRSERIPEIVWKFNSRSLASFLRGLFTASGTADMKAIKLTSTNLRLLRDVQILLTTLGIYSVVHKRSYEKTYEYIAADEKRHNYEYYELVINGYSSHIFAKIIGFESRRKMSEFSLEESEIDSTWATVERIEDVGLVEFYDFTVPNTHTYIAAGLMHHNCGEQPLLPWESCNLGSINLEKYVHIDNNGKPKIEWQKLAEDLKTVARFMDNIIDVARWPLQQLEEMVKKTRKIGVGVMGWHHMLIKLGIPYDSVDALYLAYYLAEWIEYNLALASIELARERGAFPVYDPDKYRPTWLTAQPLEELLATASIDTKPSKFVSELLSSRPSADWNIVEDLRRKYGIRNATLTSIAPTGTISIIGNASPSIEPIFAVVFERHVTVGRFIEVDTLFLEYLRKYELDSPELIEEIARRGSVSDIPYIPRTIKLLFKGALDIDPKWHVLHQAVWQQWVCAGVSKTVNLRFEATIDDVKNVYLLAWMLGCKGITVYRDKSKAQQVIYVGVKMSQQQIPKERMEKPQLEEKPIQDVGAQLISKQQTFTITKGKSITEAIEEAIAQGCPTCEY